MPSYTRLLCCAHCALELLLLLAERGFRLSSSSSSHTCALYIKTQKRVPTNVGRVEIGAFQVDPVPFSFFSRITFLFLSPFFYLILYIFFFFYKME
jgi:hypothetical protein